MGENNKVPISQEKEFEEKVKLVIGRKRKRLEDGIKMENSTKMEWLNEEGIQLKSELKKKEDENKQKEMNLAKKKEEYFILEKTLKSMKEENEELEYLIKTGKKEKQEIELEIERNTKEKEKLRKKEEKELQELNLKLANEEAEYMSQLQDEADLQQIFDALRNKRKKISIDGCLQQENIN